MRELGLFVNTSDGGKVCFSFCFVCLGVNPSNSLVVDRQRKAYIRYSLFCWGIPFVAVGTCLALHLTKTGNVVHGELGFPVL